VVRIRYLGHSAFLLSNNAGSALIDPFLTGNPLAAITPSDLNPDLILVTHAHGDHMGDAIDIAKRAGSTILSTFEIANYCSENGAKAVGAHMGGEVDMGFCRVKIFPAFHSSSLDGKMLGAPCSFAVSMSGKHIYHAGDTALFGDMKLIGEEFDLDAALLPIGGHFTMGPSDAVRAARLLKADLIIPMHYNTFDVIKKDPNEFCDEVKKNGMNCIVLRPGEEYSL